MNVEKVPCRSPFDEPWSPAGYQVVTLADEKVPVVGYQTVKVEDKESVPVGILLPKAVTPMPAVPTTAGASRPVIVVIPAAQPAAAAAPAPPQKKPHLLWGFYGLVGVVGLAVTISVSWILIGLAGSQGETGGDRNGCQLPEWETFGTQVQFARNPQEANRRAKADRKLAMVLHVSGNFEDARFTWNNAEALRVSALADFNVGNYLNRHYVSAFQKVATFQINGQQKNGGNVASYFCTPDGRVIHAVAGPVDAASFLREAQWANDTYQRAVLDNRKTLAKLQAFFRKAHEDRLRLEQAVPLLLEIEVEPVNGHHEIVDRKQVDQVFKGNVHLALSNQGKVHLLLSTSPLPRLEEIYQVVFEKILNEKVSTDPVNVAGQ